MVNNSVFFVYGTYLNNRMQFKQFMNELEVEIIMNQQYQFNLRLIIIKDKQIRMILIIKMNHKLLKLYLVINE